MSMPDEPTEPRLTDSVVLLRPLLMSDAAEHLVGEDDEQRRWFESPRHGRLDDVIAFVQRSQASWRAGGPLRNFAICDAVTNALVGNVELRDRGDGRANISYVVFPAFRRRGLAARAIRLAAD